MNAGYESAPPGYGLPNAKGAKGTEVSRKSQKDKPSENQDEGLNFDGDFSHEIIGAAIEVQRVLGVGLLESVYVAALAIELKERELYFEQEAPVNAEYKGYPLGIAYRADFVVERSVIVQLKAVDTLTEAHRAQLLSYLRLSGLKLGLLINFHGFPVVKNTQRLVNNL